MRNIIQQPGREKWMENRMEREVEVKCKTVGGGGGRKGVKRRNMKWY